MHYLVNVTAYVTVYLQLYKTRLNVLRGCNILYKFECVYVTVYTLVLIAAVRYATIVHSTSTVRYRTRRNVMIAVAAIWVLMLLVNSPILASYGVVREDDFVICDIKATNTTTQRQV